MRPYWFAVIVGLLAPLPVAQAEGPSSSWPWRYQYVAFPVPGVERDVAARLSVPSGDGAPYPAVIIAHGSGGVDGRGPLYARRLNEAGIATLEIDMWSARGLSGGLDRPDHVSETLPDAYAAKAFLTDRDDIRAEDIGLMGFSWGGVMAMLAAGGSTPETADADETEPFGALAALYPVCWGYNQVPGYRFDRVVADSLLIIAGGEDDYDSKGDCHRLLSTLPEADLANTELVFLEEATHAFDLRAPESRFDDPFAHRGEGGPARIRYSPAATKRALGKVTGFFREHLNPTPAQQASLLGKPGQRSGSIPPDASH